MSLIGHWKLDGNGEDSSTFERDGSENNLTWVDGKIGQCSEFNGANSTIGLGLGSDFFPLPSFSISTWFKSYGDTPTTGTEPAIIGFTYGIRIFVNALSISFGTDDGVTFQTLVSPDDYDFWNDNAWHHVVATCSSTEKNLYIDGNHVGTQTTTWLGTSRWPTNTWQIGRDNNNSMYYFTGLIDDFRLYDHILSLKEVKELSKAKILHYNFNDFQEPTTNEFDEDLLVNSVNDGPGTIQDTPDAFGTDNIVRRITGKVRFGNSSGIDIGTLYTGKTYTFSIYLRSVSTLPVDSVMGFDICDRSDYYNFTGNLGDNLTTTWKRFYVTADHNNSADYHFIDIGAVGGTWEWCCAQIEEKDHVTPFTTFGSREAIIYDSSGFESHGNAIEATTPTWINENKMGSGGYAFYDQRIINDENVIKCTDQLTLSAWIYLDEIRESGFIQSDYYLSCDSAGHLRAYWHDTSVAGYHVSPNVLPLQELVHVAATWTGTQCILYENGVEVKRVDTNTPGRDTSPYITFGSEGNNVPVSSTRLLHGNMYDVRIYASSLTQEDITELYQTRSSIDNAGNVYTNEIEENTYWEDGNNNSNLVLNGDANLGDNTNFSALTYNSSESCFTYTSASSIWLSDEYIPIKGDGINNIDQYVLSGEFKQPAGTMSRYYFMMACHDKYKNLISHWDVAFYSNTETTVVQEINNGDEYVYLDDITNWYDDTLDVYDHQKTFCCWPIGIAEYTPFTYSQHTQTVTFVDKVLNRLKLQNVWSLGTIPVGSQAINSYSGSSYSYIAATGALMTTEWVTKSATSAVGVANMLPGTAYVKIGMLINRDAGTETSYMRNLKFYNVTNSGQETTFSIDKNSFESSGKLVTSEVTEIGPASENLIGYWPLSGDVNDYSGNGNHGTNVGALLADGLNGSCYWFDGTGTTTVTGSVIQIPEAITSTANYPNGCTYSIWINVDTDAEAVERIGFLRGSNTIRHIELYSGSSYFRTEAAQENGYSFGTGAFPDDHRGVWSHFVIVFANNEAGRYVRWYQNGVLFHTGNLDGGVNPLTEYFSFNAIGQAAYTTSFKGKMQDFRIYQKSLNGEEIMSLYKILSPFSKNMLQINNNKTVQIVGEIKENF